MKFYLVRLLSIVLVRCSVHTPVRTPMYGLPLRQSDQRIFSVSQSVYNNVDYSITVSEIPPFICADLDETDQLYVHYEGTL